MGETSASKDYSVTIRFADARDARLLLWLAEQIESFYDDSDAPALALSWDRHYLSVTVDRLFPESSVLALFENWDEPAQLATVVGRLRNWIDLVEQIVAMSEEQRCQLRVAALKMLSD